MLLLTAPKQILMPVGPLTPAQIRSLCHAEKLREFEILPEILPTFGKCGVSRTKSYPYGGKFKTYPKWTNNAKITSYATYSDNMASVHHAIQPTTVKRAPAGMRFAADSNGLHLVRISDGMDYHPSFSEWHSLNFATIVRRGMTENYKRRQTAKRAEKAALKNKRQAERMEKIFRRDLPSTRVTLLDSRRAGNCIEGALAFAERKLGLDRTEILSAGYLFTVPAAKLLSVANGDGPRVEAAVRAAWMRETTVCI